MIFRSYIGIGSGWIREGSFGFGLLMIILLNKPTSSAIATLTPDVG